MLDLSDTEPINKQVALIHAKPCGETTWPAHLSGLDGSRQPDTFQGAQLKALDKHVKQQDKETTHYTIVGFL